MSCNKENEDSTNKIDVEITNLILTPLTCASLVNKLIKCLIYEKSQIPYPYEWLKTIVNKKRKKSVSTEDDPEMESNENYHAERHFRTVSQAYDTVELISNEIHRQFKNGSEILEILIIFGGSEMSPKEAYRIRIPDLPKGHLESNHVNLTNKLSHTVLRQIFLSQTWMTAVDTSLAPTNMFLFLKGKIGSSNFDNLQQNSSFYLTKRTTVFDINFNNKFDYENAKNLCLCNFSIYQDDKEHHALNSEDLQTHTENNIHHLEKNDDDFEWYQLDCVLKGYKEEFLKKVPLSQLW